MPFGDEAYYDGQNLPRCMAEPSEADKKARPELATGQWECALPDGHENFDNPRHQPHSWAQTGG
jgi:hypothetical protein